jgi:penicillin-binding protein 2
MNILIVLTFSLIGIRLCIIAFNGNFKETAIRQQTKDFVAETVYGNIYDCYFNPLIWTENERVAVLRKEYDIELAPESENIEKGTVIFNMPKQLAKNQLAQHIIGYEIDDTGVTGLLAGYDNFLHSYKQEYKISCIVDGKGKIWEGTPLTPSVSEKVSAGLVTTIDGNLQRICEKTASKLMDKGAIVVMDISSGEIRAMVSMPNYSSYDLLSALEDEKSPLINRALRSYSVGSCFKLLIASEALSEGLSDFEYECKGVEYVKDRPFHCHDLAGHGVQNIQDAIMNSCNTYFIKLAEQLDPVKLRETAVRFGFGQPIELANGIYADDGNLPSQRELAIPAELANFAFGQGLLLATPTQICKMTAVIANGGLDISPTLVRGFTLDGETIEEQQGIEIVERILDEKIAKELQYAMKVTNYKTGASKAMTQYTVTGVKTSTAQTGKLDKDGNQLYNAWVTGFFPTDNPQYAITVMCEDGGYGNTAASPILKEIVDSFMG